MTQHKVRELMEKYRTAVAANGTVPARDESYSMGDKKAAAGHLLWMIDETMKFFEEGRAPKAFRWLGFIQHGLIDLGLYTLDQVKNDARNGDEVEFPPPPGMQTTQASVLMRLVCAECGSLVTMLARQTWVPAGRQIDCLKFPVPDDGRLAKLGGVGVKLNFNVDAVAWDYKDLSFKFLLSPTLLPTALNEEGVAYVIGFLKSQGWSHTDEVDKQWPERWAKHYDEDGKRHESAASGSLLDLVIDAAASGAAEAAANEIAEGAKKGKKAKAEKKRKKKDKKKRKKGSDDGSQEGEPAAGGKKG